MRQLLVQVPHGHGQAVLEAAQACNGVNLAQFAAHNSDAALDLVLVHVPNRQVGNLIDSLNHLPDMHVTIIPRGVMPLRPPVDEAAEQVTDVGLRSPIEIFLAGLQSVGSWKGFLGYAAASGVVVWIGLFTNTTYLLTAAMLIAPFAGPAMNTAIATARGDWHLLQRTVLRYFAALLVTIGVTALLSLLLQQRITTELMVATSELSTVAVLLPLVAGAAGALNLVQSERSSLVSGAAIGMLVAASLAPPAGLVGMATVLGEWQMAQSGLFVLLLQLVGINLSGALVFRLFGLNAQGSRYARGRNWFFRVVMLLTSVAVIALVTWQMWSSPDLQRSTRAQRAAAEIQQVVQAHALVDMVESNVRFTRADIPDQNTLLGTIYVQRRAGVDMPAEDIAAQLTQTIQQHLLDQGFNATPLVDITVLEAP